MLVNCLLRIVTLRYVTLRYITLRVLRKWTNVGQRMVVAKLRSVRVVILKLVESNELLGEWEWAE